MNALLKLVSRWREEADLLRGYGAEEAATATEKHAREVVEALKRAEDASLTLAESSKESGYSKRRLSEMVAEGKIPNIGRRGSPRLRRGDLPMKPKGAPDGFDAAAEARSVMGVS
jgi:hypothetical protein